MAGRANSGIDPELFTAGMTLTGYYVEAGMRNFKDYAAQMVKDFGENIKPYLLSFWEGTRAYPGLDTADMTKSDDAKQILTDLDSMLEDEADVDGEPETVDDSSVDKPAMEQALFMSLFDDAVDTMHESAKSFLPHDALSFKMYIAKKMGIKSKDVTYEMEKYAQEILERAMYKALRLQVVGSGWNRAAFDEVMEKAKNLYNAQPKLNVRTGKSQRLQAFSTPLPLSLLINRALGMWTEEFGGKVEFGDAVNEEKVLEPTAGNGLLLPLVELGNNLTINEIMPDRVNQIGKAGLSAGRRTGATNVLSKDAVTEDLVEAESQDVVIMNPPFGPSDTSYTVTGVDGLDYTLTDMDHIIAARQLQAMADSGRAALILGSSRDGKIKGKGRVFLNWLYNNYIVADHFDVDGKVYERQGAAWPIQVVIISGRRTTDNDNYAPTKLDRVKGETANDIFNAVEQRLDDNGFLDSHEWDHRAVEADYVSDGNASISPNIAPDDNAGTIQKVGKGNKGNKSTKESGVPDTGRNGNDGANGTGVVDSSGDRTDTGAGTGSVAGNTKLDKRDNPDSQKPDKEPTKGGSHLDSILRNLQSVERLNDYQAAYKTGSRGSNNGVLIPFNMAKQNQAALASLISRVGDLDEYVAYHLGYKDVDDMFAKANFMGLQVDSLALAIDKYFNGGKAIIIADQTGVGKGRQAAGMIRFAMQQGLLPVFITAKPNLFTDMYFDLLEIGLEPNEINAYIMNSGQRITSETDGGKTVTHQESPKQKEHQTYLKRMNAGQAEIGSSAFPFNMIMATYSQFAMQSARKGALLGVMENAFLILDEAHEASGESSETGNYFRQVVRDAKGITYLSATFAKRPDNLGLYFRTSLGDAANSIQELQDALSAGGIQMQTLLAAMLTESGELLRRERSFEGITIEDRFDKKNRDTHVKLYDSSARILQELIAFSNKFKDFIKDENDKIKAGAQLIGTSNIEQLNPYSFASVVHNYIRNLTMAIKAETVAQRAIDMVNTIDPKSGKPYSPVIALDSTMESIMKAYMDDNMISSGESIEGYSFSTLFEHALRSTMSVTERKPNGDTEKIYYHVDDLPYHLQVHVEKIRDMVAATDFDALPVSPIDYIRKRLTDAGISSGELTGRTNVLDLDKMVFNTKANVYGDKPRREIVDDFNKGKIGVLILNRAGSTGLSIHASEKESVTNKNPRHMIVAQPSLDINVFMQMLGRINRTGQVVLPSYELLWLDLPSEKRPAAVLRGKSRSLNANTSANTDSATSVDGLDMLNHYGDEIMRMYLSENPDILIKLGLSATGLNEREELARYITGKMAVLPTEEQEELFAAVEPMYEEYVAQLKQTGNFQLETTEMDLDATIDEQQILEEGDNTNAFDRDIKLNNADVKTQGKPMSGEEMQQLRSSLDRIAGAELFDSFANAFQTYIYERYAQRIADATKAIERAHGQPDKKIKELQDALREIEARKAKEMNAAQELKHLLHNRLRLGSAIKLEIDGEMVHGMVTDIKHSNDGKGNPYAPGKFKIKLALAHPLRHVNINASQVMTGSGTFKVVDMNHVPPEGLRNIFDTEHMKPQRGQRYILTGNLIKAFSKIDGGKVINFTTQKGQNETGILLPKDFDPANGIKDKLYVTDAPSMFRYLNETKDATLRSFGIRNADNFGFARVEKSGSTQLVMVVPVSNAALRKRYASEEVSAILGREVAWRNGQKAVSIEVTEEQATKIFDLFQEQTPFALTGSALEEFARINGIEARGDDWNTENLFWDKNEEVDHQRREILGMIGRLSLISTGLIGAGVGSKALIPADNTKTGEVTPLSVDALHAKLPKEVEAILRGEGKLKPALQALIKLAPPEIKALVQKLNSLVTSKSNANVIIDDDGHWNANGAVDIKDGEIRMRLFNAKLNDGTQLRGLSYGTFLHEALHTVVLSRYAKLSVAAYPENFGKLGQGDPKAAAALQQFTNLWREFSLAFGTVKDKPIWLKEALNTPDELFVRALTDPNLQHLMAQKKYKGRTLLQRFKDWVKRMLFSLEGTHPSWLDAALVGANDLLDAMANDPDNLAMIENYIALTSKSSGGSAHYDLNENPSEQSKGGRKRSNHLSRLSSEVKSYFKKLMDKYGREKVLKVLPLSEMADLYDHMTNGALQRYYDLTEAYAAYKAKALQYAEKHVEERWADLQKTNPDEERRMSHIMLNATMSQLSPDVAFVDQKIVQSLKARIAQIELDMQAHPKGGSLGQREYKGDLEQKLIDLKRVYRDLHKEWKTLAKNSPQAQQLYLDVREHYKVMWNKTKEYLIKRITELEGDNKHKTALIDKVKLQFEKAVQYGDYFPLFRTGNYIVTSTKDKGRDFMVTRHETLEEAEAEVKAMEKEGWNSSYKVEAKVKSSGQTSVWQSGKEILGAVESINSRARLGQLPEHSGGLVYEFNEMETLFEKLSDGAAKNALIDQIYQVMLDSLPEASAAKHFIHRNRVKGASADQRRAYAHTIYHSVQRAAKIQYQHKLEAEIINMRKLADDVTGRDNILLQQVADSVQERHDKTMNPNGSAISAWLSGFGFHYLLGGSVAAATVNMTQVPLVSVPYLGSIYGYRNTKNAMFKAYADALGSSLNLAQGKGVKRIWKTVSQVDSIIDVTNNNKNLSEMEVKMIKLLQDRGKIDVTQSLTIGQTADTDTKDYTWHNRQRGQAILRAWGSMFHNAEVLNRQVTALMTIRLELARNPRVSEERLYKIAAKAIDSTQFNYAAHNRGMWTRGDYSKLIFMFKTYSVNMISLMVKNTMRARRGDEQAKKFLIGFIGMHALGAGCLASRWSVCSLNYYSACTMLWMMMMIQTTMCVLWMN
ncbi:PLxRFG domain-containing protein [Pseudobowmanella zhangzhouensis]|uniref:PLxRFG domain-containing protein n=1 Tax=Pseudobowmanella zhangzhouensis TaxID=1537679 RepID=UPI0036157CDC